MNDQQPIGLSSSGMIHKGVPFRKTHLAFCTSKSTYSAVSRNGLHIVDQAWIDQRTEDGKAPKFCKKCFG